MISHVTCSIGRSALHDVEVVRHGARAPAEDGDDDAEADDHLGGRDHQYEEDEHLSADVVEHACEGHEGEVGRVEHQLDAHEHHEYVAPHEDPQRSDREEHHAEGEVPVAVDGHPATSSAASTAGARAVDFSDTGSSDLGSPPSPGPPVPPDPPARASGSGAATGSVPPEAGPTGRRASTTAPTTAITSSAAVASNGKR